MKFVLTFFCLLLLLKLPAQIIISHGGIIRGDTSQKRIALLFTADEFADGAATITQVLKEKRMKASFFLTGNFYTNDRYKKYVSQLKADGHYLGSHSNKHLLYCDWMKRDSLLITKQEFIEDLEQSYEEMKKFGIARQDAPYFLPPYEWYNDSIAKWTKELGLTLINFTPGSGSNADYTYPAMGKQYKSSDQIVNSILIFEENQPAGLNGFLLLLHLGTDPRRADKMYFKLPALLDLLRSKGYEFVRVDELLRK